MILIVPAALLLLTAAVILIIRILRPTFPALWLIAVMGSVAAWLVVLVLRLRLPAAFTLINWSAGNIVVGSPSLLLDYSSWSFTFALATITLAVILISPGQLKQRSEVVNISGSLALGSLGILATMSANPVMLLLGWSAIDLIELWMMLRSDLTSTNHELALQVFASRFIGMMVVLWSFLSLGGSTGADISFTNLNPAGGLLLLLGIGLRIGVFPLHIPYSHDTILRRGQGTLLRVVPIASSLVVLSRFHSDTIPSIAADWLSLFAFIALLISSFRWALEKNDLSARPFWIIACSALVMLTVFNGNPFLSLSWGLTLIYLGAMVFLIEHTTRFIRIIQYITALTLIGIPFSMTSVGYQAVLRSANILWWLLILISGFLLGVGYLIHTRSKPELPAGQEQIIYLTNPLSILLIFIAFIFTGLFGWQNSRVLGYWWIPIIFTILAIVLFIWNRQTKKLLVIRDSIQHFSSTSASPRLVGFLENVINFRWIYNLLRSVFSFIGRLIQAITFLLEGNGGILWAFLVLAILLAITRTGS